MELLMRLPAGDGGAAPVARGAAAKARAARVAVVISLAVHAALVAGAASLPRAVSVSEAEPMVMVDVVVDAPPPELPPSPEPGLAPTPQPRTPAPLKRAAAPARVAPLEPAPAHPASSEPPASEEAPPAPTVAEAPAEGPGPAVLVAARAKAGDGPGGGPAGGPTGVGAAGTGMGMGGGRPLTEVERTSMIGRYRELMRGRIRDGFRYPPEARELELVGAVVLQVTVDRGGRMVAARVRGACPHAILCDDALRTVRAAAPFAPLPRELGDVLNIDVPLNYSFE